MTYRLAQDAIDVLTSVGFSCRVYWTTGFIFVRTDIGQYRLRVDGGRVDNAHVIALLAIKGRLHPEPPRYPTPPDEIESLIIDQDNNIIGWTMAEDLFGPLEVSII